MKAAAALVIAVGVFAANTAVAQYPAYELPQVVYSTPVYPSYSLPGAPSYVLPNQAYFTPVYSMYSMPSAEMAYAPVRIGIFGRLIEFERRKNAWLRQTFRGRQ